MEGPKQEEKQEKGKIKVSGTSPQPPNPASASEVHLSATVLDYLHECEETHQKIQEELKTFWAKQLSDMQEETNLKNHTLPLTRVKKVMKSDKDVERVSSEALVLVTKACELFIMELTTRSWPHAEQHKRRKLQKNDIAAAAKPLSGNKVYEFLSGILSRNSSRDVSNRGAPVPHLVRPPTPCPYTNMPPPPYPLISMPPFPPPFPYPHMVMPPLLPLPYPYTYPYPAPCPPQIGASASAITYAPTGPSMVDPSLDHNQKSQPLIDHSPPPQPPQRDQPTPDK